MVEPGFHFSSHRALGAARAVVAEYWVVQAARCRTAVEGMLPDAAVEIYFNLGPEGRHRVAANAPPSRLAHRAAWAVGPHADTLLVAKETRDCDVVGVRLRPGAAGEVLGAAARELAGGMIDLDLLWGADVDETLERLASARTHEERAAVVERAILRRMERAERRQGAGERERVRSLCAAAGRVPGASVAAIADAHGLSHRRVIALFDDHVGLKPKAFQRVERMRRVVEAIGGGQRPSWAALAAAHGYHDQAHLVHEFRRLTGLTPSAYARRRSSVGHGHVAHRLAPVE